MDTDPDYIDEYAASAPYLLGLARCALLRCTDPNCRYLHCNLLIGATEPAYEKIPLRDGDSVCPTILTNGTVARLYTRKKQPSKVFTDVATQIETPESPSKSRTLLAQVIRVPSSGHADTNPAPNFKLSSTATGKMPPSSSRATVKFALPPRGGKGNSGKM